MANDSLPDLSKPTPMYGALNTQLPQLNIPQHGMIDAITKLFGGAGDVAGSMWLDMSQGKGKGVAGTMGVPEDADQAMQQAMQIAQSGKKINLNDIGNLIGQGAQGLGSALASLFGG
jgi:hypothetical protein